MASRILIRPCLKPRRKRTWDQAGERESSRAADVKGRGDRICEGWPCADVNDKVKDCLGLEGQRYSR